MYKVIGWTSKKVYLTTDNIEQAERYVRSGGFFEIVSINHA